MEDVAPTSAADPSGTVEFYVVIFISIGASLGATAFGYFGTQGWSLSKPFADPRYVRAIVV